MGAWRLVTVGDFNGDHKPDYVLFNFSTLQTAIWYMNNNVFVSGAFGPTLPVAVDRLRNFEYSIALLTAFGPPGTGLKAVWRSDHLRRQIDVAARRSESKRNASKNG